MPITPRVEVAYWFLNEGINQAFICHYTIAPLPTTQVDINNMAAALVNNVTASIRAVITTETSFNGITFRYVGGNAGFVIDAFPTNGVGTVTGDTLPGEVSAIIRKLGSGPPKRAHGTVFFPCVPESFTENSRLTLAAIGGYQTVMNVVLGGMTLTTFDLDPVVMSRKANELYGIASFSVMSVLGHQRRRRPRR